MTFQPVIPSGGLLGWQFLKRTLPSQQAAHAQTTTVQKDLERFRSAIGAVESAADLVDNYSALNVALGAFGLQDDIGNRFFIRKVMEEGVSDGAALANRLTDPRYAALAATFDFSNGRPAALSDPDALAGIEAQYMSRDFEVQVGRTNSDLRLALGLERDLRNLAERVASDNARWFSVMGNPPLRKVFEGALGLPPSTGTLDIDRQLIIFRDKAEAVFGVSSVADFLEPERLKDLRSRFLIRSQSQSSASASPLLSLFNSGASAQGLLLTLYRS